MRTIARIGLVSAFAAVCLIGGCNKSARVEGSASATKQCNEGKACEKAAACCNASAEKAACSSEKTACSSEKAAQCPASKQQN